MSKAIVFEQPGPASNLKLVEIQDRMPSADEILIRHTAIEVNFIDILQRTGQYPLNAQVKIPGTSAVGVVEEIGSNVKDFKKGQRVGYATSIKGGGYSERNTVPANIVFGIPDDINDKVAASCLVKGLTAHYLCSRTYLPMKGKTVLIHAAAGGVGRILSQWCNHYGASVIGTVGSDAKKDIALKSGCHQVINYVTENWAQRVLELTNGFGVHCVYDSIGKDVFEGNINVLVEIGLYVSYGTSSGAPQMDFNTLGTKSLFFTRPTIFSYKKLKSELMISAIELFTMIREGKITPGIHQEIPLEQAAQAHQMIESRQTSGSIILIP